MQRFTCHEALFFVDQTCRTLENSDTGVNDALGQSLREYRKKLTDMGAHEPQPTSHIVAALESLGSGESMQGWWRDYAENEPKEKQQQLDQIRSRLSTFADKFEFALDPSSKPQPLAAKMYAKPQAATKPITKPPRPLPTPPISAPPPSKKPKLQLMM
eukprot:GEMP01095211.1.p1 GENE.GEMP01095211.1~~GEMP01095211.1.p1  ORF type:complete len:158 (+),score=38.67 GEMP01095211.1:55-528(+)